MGAINGFNPDFNGDGKLSAKEVKAMQQLGLNTSDFYEDGKLKDIKVKNNCVFLGNGEERIYERANLGNGSTAISSTSVFTNSNGEKTVVPMEDVEVSDKKMSDYYNMLESSGSEQKEKSSMTLSQYYNLPEVGIGSNLKNIASPKNRKDTEASKTTLPSATDSIEITNSKTSGNLNIQM